MIWVVWELTKARVQRLSIVRATFVVSVLILVTTGISAASALAALPDGRAYEQVSPEFKAGYPLFVSFRFNELALNGESAKFASVGAFSESGEDFALNPYIAKRTTSGWVTSGLFPAQTGEECFGGLEEMTPELSKFEYLGSSGLTTQDCSISPTETVWVREPNGQFVQTSPVMTTAAHVENSGRVAGGSLDLSRVVISRQDNTPLHVIPNDETQAGFQLFETGPAPLLRLVALNNDGTQITRYCDVNLGGNHGSFSAISQPAASEVFFSVRFNTYASTEDQCEENSLHPEELFVRVNGTATLEVSKPLPAGCTEEPCMKAATETPQEAVFQGASENGAKVFFTTTQPLVNEDKDEKNDLYMATIGCAGGGVGEECGSAPRKITSLVQVSHDQNTGQAAEVEPHVLTLSADGSHVYFVARGVLSDGPNREGETPQEGADNLYAYDSSRSPGTMTFIADLCSGPERSGAVSDSSCPASLGEESEGKLNDSELWTNAPLRHAQTTSTGTFLVFPTYARLIDSGPEQDTDSAKDIYRYDAQTGALRRVSVGEAGVEGNGNGDSFVGDEDEFNASIEGTARGDSLQEQYELESRAITDDGSIIVFTTSEPLSYDAINGQPDVYEWNEGRVGLISSGTANEPDEEPIITPSGRDIIFTTSAGLVQGDTDGLRDLYDARVGGGFPAVQAAEEPCAGDACQGPLSTPTPLLVPSSLSHPGGGNLQMTVAKTKPVKTKTLKKKKARKKKAAKKRHSTRKSVHVTRRGRHGR